MIEWDKPHQLPFDCAFHHLQRLASQGPMIECCPWYFFFKTLVRVSVFWAMSKSNGYKASNMPACYAITFWEGQTSFLMHPVLCLCHVTLQPGHNNIQYTIWQLHQCFPNLVYISSGNLPQWSKGAIKSVFLKHYHVYESLGILLTCKFWLRSSGDRSEMLHF